MVTKTSTEFEKKKKVFLGISKNRIVKGLS